MRFSALFVLLVAPLCLCQLAASQAPPASSLQPPASSLSSPKRIVYESVVALEGKTIGTNILLEISDTGAVSGWIQRNDFYPIESGLATAERISFASGGNQYDINLHTDRISYSGRDGSGNQRVEKMTRVEGRVYKLTEEADEERTMTLQTEDGEKAFVVGSLSVWKRSGQPIDRFSRLEEILGKTTGFWLTRMGAARYVALMEEPQGMDLQKKAPKAPKEKKKK